MSKIRELNDVFRSTFKDGKVVKTAGIDHLHTTHQAVTVLRVQHFDRWTKETDPDGEHIFGTLTVAGTGIAWRIDYYDKTMMYQSHDPSDPTKTHRVLTIMLASEL